MYLEYNQSLNCALYSTTSRRRRSRRTAAAPPATAGARILPWTTPSVATSPLASSHTSRVNRSILELSAVVHLSSPCKKKIIFKFFYIPVFLYLLYNTSLKMYRQRISSFFPFHSSYISCTIVHIFRFRS